MLAETATRGCWRASCSGGCWSGREPSAGVESRGTCVRPSVRSMVSGVLPAA